MKNAIWIVVAFSMMFVASASATIINIPGDYPRIQEGIDASADGDTVLVQPGTYVENINFNGHNIVLGSLSLITREDSYVPLTIIDGDSLDTVIKLWSGENNTAAIVGFTIRNGYGWYGGGISCRHSDPLIANNIIIQNSSDWAGGGIFCWSGSNPAILNNTISNNFAPEGGGLLTCWSHPTIIKNVIVNNAATQGAGIAILFCDRYQPLAISKNIIARNEAAFGGGIYSRYSTFSMANNTITENLTNHFGTGLYLEGVSNSTILNTIFWGNSPSEIYVGEWSDPVITYCDIQDTVWVGEGNISADPIFCYPDTLNYYLRNDSPCVGAGQDGTNIGALDVGCYHTEMHELDELLPVSFVTLQAFPNPFNSSTIIEYTLPKSSNLTIIVYDVLGQQVDVLSEQFQLPGKYQHTWKAKDFSSGVYFVLLKTPDYSEIISVTLLK